ncbi:MAG: PorT family protein [Flavobacteriales bacterium]|nr:PorT family protein [Flavobacteriales bacterium]
MKQFSKIVTLILFSSLFLNNLLAQEDSFENDPVASSSDDIPKFRFGIHLSPNISWLKPNTKGYENEGAKFGFTYGLSAEFFLSKNYLFSTGFYIANLGGELSYQGVYEDNNGLNIPSVVKQTYSIKYIEIPLTLKLRTNEIGYMTYYGQFGLKAGVKFKSTSDYTYLDINNSPKVEDVNTASDIFFINTYLVFGAGVEYNISGNTSIMVGLTYNNGFINQIDRKFNEVDGNGKSIIDNNGEPVLSSKDASANLSYVSLNIGFYF